MMQAYVIFNQGVEQYLGRNLRPVANLAEAIMFRSPEEAEKNLSGGGVTKCFGYEALVYSRGR